MIERKEDLCCWLAGSVPGERATELIIIIVDDDYGDAHGHKKVKNMYRSKAGSIAAARLSDIAEHPPAHGHHRQVEWMEQQW